MRIRPLLSQTLLLTNHRLKLAQHLPTEAVRSNDPQIRVKIGGPPGPNNSRGFVVRCCLWADSGMTSPVFGSGPVS
ncbi:hypothetical protein F4814DRAFT_400139 [Daldinia grandis]|nr:hypothetical protein F4814DRAFT_400139 [Daldinia grandis]